MSRPNSWDELQDLFEQALQLAPEERDSFLDRQCGANDQLRAEVVSLLNAYHLDDDAWEASPIQLVDKQSPAIADVPEDAIPGYLIIKELHRGGQGIVYLARQEGTKREVALKVMLQGPFASPGSKRRFEREIELVGSLRNPGIVPIFESGETRGMHYYVMDYIRGECLDAFVKNGKLSIKDRLKLFAKICAIVDYAHQNGVIHRDLKPSNVLVDAQGEPHVVDFGLAKIGAKSQADAPSSLVSVTGEVMGTLAYMSPEQAAGHPDQIDVRSDVYTLGVVLYEMLADELPYGSLHTLADHMHAIQTVEPRRLARRIPGVGHEVETIVFKAISKEKPRRYATAGALGDDINRYLEGRALEAKRDSALYIIRKILQRNLVPALIVSGFMLMILISSIVSFSLLLSSRKGWQAANLASENYRAERDEVRRRGDIINRNLYFAEMNLAGQAIQEPGGIDSIRRLTSRWEPVLGAEDLRGWEWYYLDARSHREQMTLRGHDNWARSVDWHPDGSRLVSSGQGNDIILWNAESGRPIKSWETGAVRHVCFSPDGSMLASSGNHGELKIWDAESDEPVRTLVGHSDNTVHCVEWSPDGKYVASAGNDGTVKIWNVDTAQEVCQLAKYESVARSVSWSPNGELLASACHDGRITIWNVADREPVDDWQAHDCEVLSISWSPDGSMLVSTSQHAQISVWDTSSAELVWEATVSIGAVLSSCWHPDSKRFATAHWDRSIRVWETDTGHQIHALDGHTQQVFGVSWSSDGKRLASASLDHTLKIWNMTTANCDRAIYAGDGSWVNSCDWNSTGRCLAWGTAAGGVRIWDRVRDEMRPVGMQPGGDGQQGNVSCVSWSPDAELLASGGVGGVIGLWHADRGEKLGVLSGHRGAVCAIAWHPSGAQLASAGVDRVVNIWQISDRTITLPLEGHDSEVFALDFSPDGNRLASGAKDGTVYVWDLNTHQVIHRFAGNRANGGNTAVRAVRFDPTGQLLATGCLDHTIKICDLTIGTERLVVESNTGGVPSLDWSADGTRLVAAANNGSVKVLDTTSGSVAVSLAIHTDAVSCVRWSPDGQCIASAGLDHTLNILDATIGYERQKANQVPEPFRLMR